MSQPRKTHSEIADILSRIECGDRKIRLLEKGTGYLLQLQYMEPDIHTGKMELQSARKWYISPFMTETEIVETAFKACRVSFDHQLKEHFLYRGRRVYSPHFSIEARLRMCDENLFDGRIPKE